MYSNLCVFFKICPNTTKGSFTNDVNQFSMHFDNPPSTFYMGKMGLLTWPVNFYRPPPSPVLGDVMCERSQIYPYNLSKYCMSQMSQLSFPDRKYDICINDPLNSNWSIHILHTQLKGNMAVFYCC